MSSTYVTKLNYLEETKELIKQAIIDKGVDVSDTDTFRVYADKISEISGGGEEPTGEILYRFLDYDGKLLYTFTEEEKNALTELPAMTETHEGMHFVGWTWTLDELKAVSLGANVGALWDTDDGLTHLLITVKEPVEMQIQGNRSYSLTVNWGDGSSEETVTGEGNWLYHQYDVGDYDIALPSPAYGFNLSTFNWDTLKPYPYWNIDFKELRLGPNSFPTTATANITLGLKKFSRGSNNSTSNNSAFSKESLDFIATRNLLSSSNSSAYQRGPYPCYKYTMDMTRIGNSAFRECSSLQSITIPDGVTSIGNAAFGGCTSLQTINIPDGVTSIDTEAFSYCESIKEITLPDSITSLGSGYSSGSIFSYCSSLQNVKLPNSVTSLGSGIFKYCSSLKEISIPNTVTNIEGNAFEYCTSLVNVNIPEGITQIKQYTFKTCGSLQSINIPDGVTSIGNYTFEGCELLQTITIPASVTDMNGSSIFSYCSSLIEYHMKPTTPPTLNSYAFGYGSTLPNTNAKIYVPYSEDHSVLAAYQSATNWSKYANYMVEEEV